MNYGLKQKVVLITGAGRGIGRGIAEAFAREGASVVVNDVDSNTARTTADQIHANFGVPCFAAPADVGDAAQVDRMVSQVKSSTGKVDVLVNNAGIYWGPEGPTTRFFFVDSKPEDWQPEVRLVLFGVMNCCRAVLPGMVEHRSGRIISIASDAGRMGMSRTSVYGGAKGGVIALTRGLAVEVGQHNITVNAVSPGLVASTRAEMAERQRDTHPEQYEHHKAVAEQMAKSIPMARIGKPEDIANVVLFLASEGAGWITGQTLSVNGGYLMP